MVTSYFHEKTLDDLMRSVVKAVKSHGEPIQPGKGAARELLGVILELMDARARLSRTETRGKIFSCLGEFCWYLAASNKLDFIQYYIPKYAEYADGNIIPGAYGPRLLTWKGASQVQTIINLLRSRPDSRRAVIQLFDATDILNNSKDVPCTCTIQFLLRKGKLHMFTCMRSNDIFIGLPHDIFFFTMLQEIVARTLSVELGTYKHAVGSLHLYDKNSEDAQSFLDEGWQSSGMPMPPMPEGDPWTSIKSLLDAESTIRSGNAYDIETLETLDPYWADLVRLLLVLRYKKDEKHHQIAEIAENISSPAFRLFIPHQ